VRDYLRARALGPSRAQHESPFGKCSALRLVLRHVSILGLSFSNFSVTP
jgi:hypothetical protein